jgi:hypothetical protein
MYVTGTDVSRRVPSPKDGSVKAFRGYTSASSLSILYCRFAWLAKAQQVPFFGLAPLPLPPDRLVKIVLITSLISFYNKKGKRFYPHPPFVITLNL